MWFLGGCGWLPGYYCAVTKELWVVGRVLLWYSVTKGNLPHMRLLVCCGLLPGCLNAVDSSMTVLAYRYVVARVLQVVTRALLCSF